MIYLDHNATTPVRQEVFEAMRPYFSEEWGNPSSSYRFGSKLKSAIETAREQLAELIGAQPHEVLFTSCGTESNNAAIHSAIMACPQKRHIITSQVEHSSVLSYCRFLERHHACRVTYLSVDREGLLSLADLENALTADTAVVSLMWANNETGVQFPVEEIAALCRSHGVLYHCDAVQAAGKTLIDVRNVPIDYLSITAHKLHGPKGIGGLYVNEKATFQPFVYGGHQELGRRGGTEALPLIVGLGLSAELARKELPDYQHTVRPLRDALEEGILSKIPDSQVNGHKTLRLVNTANIAIRGIENVASLAFLDQAGICASSGSACMESTLSPSHVIAAMTHSHGTANESIRFSLSMSNTAVEVETTVQKLRELVTCCSRN